MKIKIDKYKVLGLLINSNITLINMRKAIKELNFSPKEEELLLRHY